MRLALLLLCALATPADWRTLARSCAEKHGGHGVHGATLDYASAVAEPRRGGWYAVHIPEQPPMNERVPNGMSLLVHVQRGQCKQLPMR